MKIERSVEEIISNLFQNCDVCFEDVKVNCDPEHVLNGNRRSRYEQFHFIRDNCVRINPIVENVCASPAKYLKELARVFKKRRNFRRLTWEYI